MTKKIFTETTFRIMEIYTRNIYSSFYGRDIARKLKANQRTVQLHLNTLEKEKILTSNIKGKLKEFSLNHKNPLTKQILLFAEIFKSYKFMSSDFEIYQIMSDLLKTTKDVIIVYGSFVKGYAMKGSDLDILIVGKLDKKKISEIEERYSKEIHFMVMTKKKFLNGMKNKANFMLEILENHIICQGFEKFIDWRYQYG